MLAYNIKEILTLIPEAQDLIKSASVEEEFPTDSKDSVCASYLRVGYLTKVANKRVDPEITSLITKAAMLYGVKDQLDKLSLGFSPKLEKSASEQIGDLAGEFEYSLNSHLNLEKTAELAEKIYDLSGGEVSDDRIKRYSGNAYLNKQAAVQTLANRYHATKQDHFVKIARLVADSVKENDFDSIKKICQTVTFLDKQAGLDILGFNFYKEALITKQAAMTSGLTINLAGQPIPYTKIAAFGKSRLTSVLGPDLAKELKDSPVDDKYVLESLPRDIQLMLVAALKGI